MPEYLTVKEVAELTRIHPDTIRRWLRDGVLSGRHIGREWRVSQADLTKFLDGEGGEIDEDEWQRSKAGTFGSGGSASVDSSATSGGGFSASASFGRSLTPRIIG